jgi:hypothetical protein
MERVTNMFPWRQILGNQHVAEATPWFKRLVAGFPPRRPGFESGSGKWNLWWTKWRWGRFPPSASVSPANINSTKFSIITITRGRYNRPVVADVPSGHNMDSTPHYANEKHVAEWYTSSHGERFLETSPSLWDKQTFPWIRIRYIRDQNWVQISKSQVKTGQNGVSRSSEQNREGSDQRGASPRQSLIVSYCNWLWLRVIAKKVLINPIIQSKPRYY